MSGTHVLFIIKDNSTLLQKARKNKNTIMKSIENIIKLYRDFGSDLMDSVGGGLGGAISSGLGGIMGLAFQGEQNANQVSQAQKLGQIQVNDSEQLAAYNEQEQQQLWNYTNYPNQVKELEAAGLNPGLLYAKPGGGGTTGVAAPTIGGQQAPNANPVGMGLQNGAMNAETMADINLKNAQAEKIKSDTPPDAADNTGTAQSKVLQAQVPKIQADTQNTEADTALTKVNTQIAGLTAQLQGKTLDDQATIVHNTAQQSAQILQQGIIQTGVDQATANSKIQQAALNVIQTMLQNANIQASTQNTQANTQVQKATVGNVQQDTALKAQQTQLTQSQIGVAMQAVKTEWENAFTREAELDVDKSRLRLQQQMNDIPESGKLIGNILDVFGIFTALGKSGGQRNIIQGFQR